MIPGPSPTPAPLPRPWYRRPAVTIALAILACLAAAGLYFRTALVRRAMAYREESFLRQADAAYRGGELRAGDMAVRSALELSPGNPRAKLLQARWLLRLGHHTAGIAVWQSILAQQPPEAARTYTLTYASQLLECGAFEGLRDLALRQLASDQPFEQSLWVHLAAESCRVLRHGPSAEEAARLRQPHLAAALRAYTDAERGDQTTAKAALQEVRGASLPHAVAVLAARAWLRLGDLASARAAVNHSGRPSNALEATALELIFPPDDSILEGRIINQMLVGAASAPDLRRRVGLIVTFGLPRASRAVAATLFTTLRPQEARLDAETLSAVWAFTGLAGEEVAEAFWRQRLEARLGVTLPRLQAGALNPRLFGVIAERTPMTIEIVCSLLSTLPAIAPPAP